MRDVTTANMYSFSKKKKKETKKNIKKIKMFEITSHQIIFI